MDNPQARELAIAGPGTRSYAFIVDWHVRVLLALAWLLPVWLWLMTSALSASGPLSRRAFNLYGVLPALLIYLLYHPVLELLMRGVTPGKRIAGVRLVTRAGGRPGAGAIVTRNVFRLIDSLPFLYVVGLISCLVSAQRVRIGDMAAGTVLVLDPVQPGKASEASAHAPSLSAHGELDGALLQLISELLERWPSLSPGHRDALARSLLARADGNSSSAALAQSDDQALQQRLRALASGTGARIDDNSVAR